jgi:hypothetical protein
VGSRHSGRSEWMSREAAFALAAQRPIIPVMLDDGGDLPFLLRNTAYIDFRDEGRFEENVATLAAAIADPRSPGVSSRDADVVVRLTNDTDKLVADGAAKYLALTLENEKKALRYLVLLAVFTGLIALTAISLWRDLPPWLLAVFSSMSTGLVGFYFGREAKRPKKTPSQKVVTTPTREAP